jgi:GTP-binding protein EngB required for normal cell division
MDKLKQSERKAAITRALKTLELDEEQVVPFSSKTGEGRDTLLAALQSLLDDDATPVDRPPEPLEEPDAP